MAHAPWLEILLQKTNRQISHSSGRRKAKLLKHREKLRRQLRRVRGVT